MGPFPAPPGFRWVFCMYFTHYISHDRVYRKDGKILCHNICCLISAFYELGIGATFWGDSTSAA